MDFLIGDVWGGCNLSHSVSCYRNRDKLMPHEPIGSKGSAFFRKHGSPVASTLDSTDQREQCFILSATIVCFPLSKKVAPFASPNRGDFMDTALVGEVLCIRPGDV